jgi:hypothetical protein
VGNCVNNGTSGPHKPCESETSHTFWCFHYKYSVIFRTIQLVEETGVLYQQLPNSTRVVKNPVSGLDGL